MLGSVFGVIYCRDPASKNLTQTMSPNRQNMIATLREHHSRSKVSVILEVYFDIGGF